MASAKASLGVPERELNDFADGKSHSVTSVPFTTGQLRFECRSGVQPAACRTRDGRPLVRNDHRPGCRRPESSGVELRSAARPNYCAARQRRAHELRDVSLAPSQRNIEIRYAGLSFLLPEKVTFRYLLEGYDKAWTDAGVRVEAFYTNLPPGRFRVRVRARNSDGVWGLQTSSVAFTIQPRLYQRSWFWPAAAGLLTLLIFAGYRRRVRRIQKTFSLLLAERSRIARELHDTLLQGIAGVTMQMQALWTRMPAGSEKQVLGGIIRVPAVVPPKHAVRYGDFARLPPPANSANAWSISAARLSPARQCVCSLRSRTALPPRPKSKINSSALLSRPSRM